MATRKERLLELLRKHLITGLNQEELAELRTYDEPLITQLLGELLDSTDIEDLLATTLPVPRDRMYSDIIRRPEVGDQLIWKSGKTKTRKILWWGTGAAAAVVCVCMLLFRDRLHQTRPAASSQSVVTQPIVPGGNKAVLTMADGQSIVLHEDQAGIIVGAESITYQDGSNLTKKRSVPMGRQNDYSSISVPKGGTYRITLSDGTAVWINSDSQLRYPTHFNAADRTVYLEGEAFFDVAKRAQPFRVVTREQTVEVLGTQFNISAYTNEETVQTTLLNGKVAVINQHTKRSSFLTPGQQSAVAGEKTTVSNVDVGLFTAWKEGYFAFPDVNIQQALKAIARWYDIDFDYQDDFSGHSFGGTISRFEDFQTLLETIALTGSIKFEIQGRRVMVKK